MAGNPCRDARPRRPVPPRDRRPAAVERPARPDASGSSTRTATASAWARRASPTARPSPARPAATASTPSAASLTAAPPRQRRRQRSAPACSRSWSALSSSGSASRRRSRSPPLHDLRPSSRRRTTCSRTRRCGSPAWRSARSRRSSPPRTARRPPMVTMRIERQGPADPQRRDAARSARASSSRATSSSTSSPARRRRRSSRDGDRIPVDQTAAPVQLDQILSALPGATRAPTCRASCDELSKRPRRRRRARAEPLDPVLGARLPRHRRSSPTRCQGTEDHDLSRFIANEGRTAAALDRHATALKALDRRLRHDRARRSPPGPALSRRGRRAAAHARAPPSRRCARSTPRSRRCARLIRDARPAVRSTGPDARRGRPVRRSRSAASSPSPSCAACRATCARRAAARRRSRSATVPLFQQVRAASSCQNEVVLPWSKDTIEDKAFPAEGPVYEEATKPLPGLAGESRSGDANGQWFRVLVAGAEVRLPARHRPLLLHRATRSRASTRRCPQNHKRSPLRPDVPCETQQPPDLRTIPQTARSGFPLPAPTPRPAARSRSQDARRRPAHRRSGSRASTSRSRDVARPSSRS